MKTTTTNQTMVTMINNDEGQYPSNHAVAIYDNHNLHCSQLWLPKCISWLALLNNCLIKLDIKTCALARILELTSRKEDLRKTFVYVY